MDYEKKYNRALEIARSYFYQSFDINETLKIIFPELADGEDDNKNNQ